MIPKDYYLDFKWLASQKQWNAYENFLQDKIEEKVMVFKTDGSADLKVLQIQVQTIEAIKNAVRDYIESIEEMKKEG